MVRRNDHQKIAKFYVEQAKTKDLKASAEFIAKLLEYRKLDKLRKTYIRGIQKAVEHNGEDKVYCQYNLDGAKTGRLSNSGYDNPKGVSFHTLPREDEHNIRNMFVAPEGWCMLTADYSQMELRVLSCNAREKVMQKAFLDDEDLHSYTASLLFEKEISKVTKKERQIAKNVSFLIVYGGGAYRLSAMVNITMPKAQAIINKYRAVFPGIIAYESYVHNFIRKNGYAFSLFGRRRNLLDVYSKVPKVVKSALRQGLNFTVQSTASDILLVAIKAINIQLRLRGLCARLFATVHDSIEILCPFGELEEVCAIVYNEMVNYPLMREEWDLEFDVPLKVDIGVGPSFGDNIAAILVDGKLTNAHEIIEYVKNFQAA